MEVYDLTNESDLFKANTMHSVKNGHESSNSMIINYGLTHLNRYYIFR